MYVDTKQITDRTVRDLPWIHDSQISRNFSNFVKPQEERSTFLEKPVIRHNPEPGHVNVQLYNPSDLVKVILLIDE